MAKFIFGKKIKEKELKEEGIKIEFAMMPQKKKKKKLSERILDIAAEAVEEVDEINEELVEITKAGGGFLISVCGSLVSGLDLLLDICEWFIIKTAVIVGRKWHQGRLLVIKHKNFIIKESLVLVLATICLVGVFAWGTDYEYSYNGRALGIVKEQKDVVEILDMVSEELSLQHGSSIVIDPNTDISFRPVVSHGKEIDDSDTVLRRFTYMGEIQAQACAIKANGKVLVVVENEEIAKQVLESIQNIFLNTSEGVKYEYIGFVEDVEIEPCSTTLNNVSSLSTAVRAIRNGGQEATVYVVEGGDTIYGICEKLGISFDQLQAMNPGLTLETTLHAGDTFNTQKEIPLLTLKTIEVSTFAESIPYGTDYNESSYYYRGESIVTRAGVDGKASITARLTRYNGDIVEREDLNSEVLTEPINEIITKGTKPVPPKKGTGTFIRPVNVGIYSEYGYRWGRLHEGVDLAAPTGTAIRAADGGTVTYAGWFGAYGYTVRIDHGGNVETLYAHCSELYVSAGESVFQGQTIAAVGSTGRSTGPHCHFEIMINGGTVNPAYYI